MSAIKHIWFDFSNTIAFPNVEAHNKVRYETYSEAVGRPVTQELVDEYEALFEKYRSNSGVFTSLGFGSDYWAQRFAAVPLELAEPEIPSILDTLRTLVPLSMWSNIRARQMLPAIGIDASWFSHIIGPDEVKNPKPALDGFKLIIEKSQLPPENILFVGDDVRKEILPAKSLGIQAGLAWDTSPEADYCFQSFREILNLVRP